MEAIYDTQLRWVTLVKIVLDVFRVQEGNEFTVDELASFISRNMKHGYLLVEFLKQLQDCIGALVGRIGGICVSGINPDGREQDVVVIVLLFESG